MPLRTLYHTAPVLSLFFYNFLQFLQFFVKSKIREGPETSSDPC